MIPKGEPTYDPLPKDVLGLQAFYQSIYDNLPVHLFVFEASTTDDFRLIIQNSPVETPEKSSVANPYTLLQAEDRYTVEKLLADCFTSQKEIHIEQTFEISGKTRWYENIYLPIFNDEQVVSYLVALWDDITTQKEAEIAEQEQQVSLIEQQAIQLKELSSPILSISEDIMVMPLVGAIDSGRIQHIMEHLLMSVSKYQASIIIIDITGVPIVDERVADDLLRVSQAVRLLGAEVVLTGIRPEVAQILVTLSVDLSQLTSRGTLRDGIRYALSCLNTIPNSYSIS
jgi:anti-anti-sigma regulatory factor